MLRFLLIQPGATDLDEQGRIKGSLDIPLNDKGADQVARIVEQLAGMKIDRIYSAPCRSARQTAEAVAADHRVKLKCLDKMQNVDHGLWHGKLIEEVKTSQPKMYKQYQDHPEQACPPGGEPMADAVERVQAVLIKLLKKHKSGTVALVVPDPLASVVRSLLRHCELNDLWQSEQDNGDWELIELDPGKMALSY